MKEASFFLFSNMASDVYFYIKNRKNLINKQIIDIDRMITHKQVFELWQKLPFFNFVTIFFYLSD